MSSSPSSNIAAYQTTFKSRPFSLQPAPMPTPKASQIVIRSQAIGINPADAAVQNLGLVYTADKFPIVPGFDVAGTVHAVGESVARFKPGDRVCAFTIDMSKDKMETPCENGAFQLYCVASENLAAKVPENVSFAEAAVFPSCLTTAAYSLFVKDALALDLPPIDGPAEHNGKVFIVWGGSSVVGSCAIQMATLAGYTVVATSSEMNFGHCRVLGAESVFDYKSASVVEDIVAACKATGKESAGAFVAYFNDESTVKCSQIVSQIGGSKIVGTVVPPHMPVPEGVAEGVKIAPNWGPDLASMPEGVHLWQHWLTAALADGRMKLSPRPEVHGQGLEALQGAVDAMYGRIHMAFSPKAGEAKSISPRKLVVEIV